MKQNIFLYAVLSLFTITTATGCDKHSESTLSDYAIRVETAEVTAIASDNAISGGRIIGEKQVVTEFGICWATTDNPTVSDNHSVGAGNANSFACYATELSASTNYYVRAYAATPNGTVYGQTRRRSLRRVTIRLLPGKTTVRIRSLRPFICGRRAIWRKLRTIRAVKGLIRILHRSALI